MHANNSKFRLGKATYSQSKYACENWHYLRSLPASRTHSYSCFEGDRFVGVIIYGHGNNCNEDTKKARILMRVALSAHHAVPTSAYLSRSLKIIKKEMPGLDKIISYVDRYIHTGTIYKATNWKYVASTKCTHYELGKTVIPHRTIYPSKAGSKKLVYHPQLKKHEPRIKDRYEYIYCDRSTGSGATK